MALRSPAQGRQHRLARSSCAPRLVSRPDRIAEAAQAARGSRSGKAHWHDLQQSARPGVAFYPGLHRIQCDNT